MRATTRPLEGHPNDRLRRSARRATSLRVRSIVGLVGCLAVSACGSSGGGTAVQNNKSVQRTEAQVQQQVTKCLPTSGGTPDPLLLTRSSARAKFASCTGVGNHLHAFEACSVKLVLGGLPTTARLQKGLTVCVEKNA